MQQANPRKAACEVNSQGKFLGPLSPLAALSCMKSLPNHSNCCAVPRPMVCAYQSLYGRSLGLDLDGNCSLALDPRSMTLTLFLPQTHPDHLSFSPPGSSCCGFDSPVGRTVRDPQSGNSQIHNLHLDRPPVRACKLLNTESPAKRVHARATTGRRYEPGSNLKCRGLH